MCFWLTVRSADDPEPLIAEGTSQGEMRDEPAGSGGFAYAPYFYMPAIKMTSEEQNAVSHRGAALRMMAKLLSERWGW